MTFRGTLLLWVGVAALGVYVWSSHRGSPAIDATPPSASTTAPRAPLFRFDETRVETIDLADVTGVLRFRRDATGWRNGSGTLWPAPEPLTALVQAISDLSPLRIIAEPADSLADYGLDPPKYRVTLVWRENPQGITLALGDRNPTWTAVYARTGPPDDRLVLVGSRILWEIDKITRAVRTPPARADPESKTPRGG